MDELFDDEVVVTDLPEVSDRFWDEQIPDLPPEANIQMDNHEWISLGLVPQYIDKLICVHQAKFECRKCGVIALTAVGEIPSRNSDFSCHDMMIDKILDQ